MKKLVVLVMFVFSGIGVFAQSNAQDIIGVWETESKDGKMEVYPCGDQYCGKLLYGASLVNPDGTSKKDVKNPDRSLQSRDMIGSVILTGLTFDGEEYNSGRIYNAANGQTYKCYVWLKNDVLHLRGYLGIPAFGQTAKWNRIK